jgi:hypothetical protein
LLPANFFNVNSPRGLLLATPGTGFQVSGATTDSGAGQPAPPNFGNLNGNYSATFQVFSAQRLFTPLDSNIFDVIFNVPGTSVPAFVSGFGCVLADVDQSNTTSLNFFDRDGASLGTFFVPAFSSGLSFLGVSFSDISPSIARVRVTLGNATIGPNDNNTTSDIVVADDFIYGEPTDRIFGNGFD